MAYKIGYLGPKGTFTKIAVDAIFNGDEKKGYTTIPECMDAVEQEEIKYAVLPLENAIEGTVNLTLDYLIEKKPLKIISEVIVPIRQHLMVHPSHVKDWKNIEVIHSHPHAIAQCHHFLHEDMKQVRTESVSSTGAAAKYVSEHPELKVGAIANHLAAEEYGLSIVKKDIHDFTNNHTRFVVLHKYASELFSKKLEVKGYKTTLMITLPSDHPGALHQVLSAFAWRKVNLSKIESRPMKTGLGNYFFLIDIEQKMDDVLIPNAIAELESLGCSVEVLGSYPYFLFNGLSLQV
ncbi:prephenate dehydratase [Aquibacillus rhizosphaerae]|uniref:Prephenate dehydratase n=1 Tax=Aquibacillus rhizosphaerae TaxID=3051431 RepID=A0ABT7L727_9BACI|nr:prephenate dehydratase [Aquibacillus sp. LR5S19]MDL4841653.1 prephenate dehydratase [Aquibacillus sp. LR5S19]